MVYGAAGALQVNGTVQCGVLKPRPGITTADWSLLVLAVHVGRKFRQANFGICLSLLGRLVYLLLNLIVHGL